MFLSQYLTEGQQERSWFSLKQSIALPHLILFNLIIKKNGFQLNKTADTIIIIFNVGK